MKPGETHVFKNSIGGRLFVVHKVDESGHWVTEQASLPSQQKYYTPVHITNLIPCKDAAMANRVMLLLKEAHESTEKLIRMAQTARRLRYDQIYKDAGAGKI